VLPLTDTDAEDTARDAANIEVGAEPSVVSTEPRRRKLE
jgi:hypothetical protein